MVCSLVNYRIDGNQNNLRNAAYEAIMEMMKNSPTDCYPVVRTTLVIVLDKLEKVLQMEVSSTCDLIISPFPSDHSSVIPNTLISS